MKGHAGFIIALLVASFVGALASIFCTEPLAGRGDPVKALREYLEAKTAGERERALATLDGVAVPRDPVERARLLKGALARPAHPASSRVTEMFGDPPAETFFATPAGYVASGSHPALLGLSAYCADPHFSLRPFALPREELAEAPGKPRIPWEDGLVLAPTIPDIAEFDSSTYIPVRKRVMGLIAHANRTFAVDPDRLVAVGLSLGSTVAYDMASRHPDRFAAIADVSGGCPRHTTPLTNLANLNVYVFHGDKDEVVPVEIAHQIDAFLTAKKIPHVLDIAAGGQHAFPETPEQGEKIRAWLREKKRNAWPRELDLALFPPRETAYRIYWLELDTGDEKGTIAVSVANNVITFGARKGVGNKVVLHLGEPLVDLEREVVVRSGEVLLHRGKLERSFRTLLADFETDGWDSVRAAPARLEVELPR